MTRVPHSVRTSDPHFPRTPFCKSSTTCHHLCSYLTNDHHHFRALDAQATGSRPHPADHHFAPHEIVALARRHAATSGWIRNDPENEATLRPSCKTLRA
ncbi:hypothetical protein PHLGIDRAFT_254273 [Phlebiopsis gigantea 11061_1 CR5-6]|uniref:Uncharacterized protein n=1 Tax=Phlebiopsis gigantea (strain 11061_1 CR5-6) TaxID=745531 RepID=A0A0C3RS75_PHLG1|nr:hypothetical protein PHLGIDRAFT_254273 [Phlebiopsis gigantea 11061_1 CR5-6]